MSVRSVWANKIRLYSQKSLVLCEALDAYFVGLLHGLCKIVRGLHTVPRLRAAPERLVQADRHFGRDSSLTADDFGEMFAGDTELFCGFSNAQSKRFQAIVTHGMSRMRRVFHMHTLLPMIISQI